MLPSTQTIVDGTTNYSFTISATGTLTLHVTSDGTAQGSPVVGATFYRCDSSGATYGNIITTDSSGNATFSFVPYSIDGTSPNIYYKQISSDGEHTFNAELQTISLNQETLTTEISFALTDANYQDLPIENGQIVLSSS